MAKRTLPQRVARVVRHTPGVKRLPAVKLLAAAEVLVMARDHLQRLSPAERHRIVELIRIGHGRKRNLTEAQRAELESLIAKAEPRLLAGKAAEVISPVPLPRRLVYGRQRR
ncbi:MAG TPA: hypothetical protein VE992_02630 [Solirubrobacteraceae bacterium]|nr:hypothetical protein [Solirubrobacteraceae bacterium]